MGFDLTEGWAAIMKKQADDLGYSFEIRDPNWSTDAGTRAITAIIAEKPDLAIIHNPDLQSYARLEQRMVKEGIKVLQVNLETTVPTDYYVGADWVKVGLIEAQALVEKCGKGSGTSGKVAILEGQPTAASNLYELYAYYKIFGENPEIKVVADQAATYDPAKARAITETVLQQHPDLCGIVGNWDNQDVGAGAAVAGGRQGRPGLHRHLGRRQPDRLRQHQEGPARHDRQLRRPAAGRLAQPSDRRAVAVTGQGRRDPRRRISPR